MALKIDKDSCVGCGTCAARALTELPAMTRWTF